MITINRSRFLNDLRNLWTIGATPEGGVTRRAFSAEDMLGRQWFEQRVREAGLRFDQDGAANLYATLYSPDAGADAPTLLCGSHLDTVPNGGRYDGSLGMLCALESLRTIQEAGLKLPFHLSAVSFTDEEGSIHGLFGSQAVAGILTTDNLNAGRGGFAALEAGMARLNISAETVLTARRQRGDFVGYVEVHIEQGKRLERSGTDIGVVTGIVGIRSAMLTFVGEAAHAGAKPMAERRDALWGAAAFVQQARERVQTHFHPGVCNFGQISAEPGAFNIVPERVQLALEFRHGTESLLDEMQVALFELAQTISADFTLDLHIETYEGCVAAPSDESLLTAIETACDAVGLTHKRMMSFAGHDAQSMASITPSAMIFVPSVDGVSHRHNELTSDMDCVNGANVLLHTLLTMIERA